MPTREDVSFVATAVLEGALNPSQGRDLLSWKEFAETHGTSVNVDELAVGCGLMAAPRAEAIRARALQVSASPTPSATSEELPQPSTPDPGSQRDTRVPTTRTRKADHHGVPGYEIMGRAGSGSMGTVYIARHEPTGRKVALKALSARFMPRREAIERFYREANILRSLRHPNIVQAYEAGATPNGQPYLVMEFVDGQSVAQRLRQDGRLSEEETIRIGRAVSQALHHLHARGFVHRDVKPENILITHQGEVKLADFGLAKHLDDTFTTNHETTVGTPLYMSPEQARGRNDTDARSDIYSLGCNLFHMLAGSPPYPDKHPLVVMTKHLYEKTPWVQHLAPGTSAGLSRVIFHMMMKERDQRYPTIRDVALDLDRVAVGEEPLRPLCLSRATPQPADEPRPATRVWGRRVRQWFEDLFPAHALPEFSRP